MHIIWPFNHFDNSNNLYFVYRGWVDCTCSFSTTHTSYSRFHPTYQYKQPSVGHSITSQPNIHLLALLISKGVKNTMLFLALQLVLKNKYLLHSCSFIVLKMWLKTHKKRTNISLKETARKSKQNERTHLFSDYKRRLSLSVLTDSKTVHKNNDRIYFLCIGCNPQHCGSIFNAWITARKQSLLVLSMQGTQKRENRWEWVETKKMRIGLGVENKSKQPQELETTTVWLQQQTWHWLYLLISWSDLVKICGANKNLFEDTFSH